MVPWITWAYVLNAVYEWIFHRGHIFSSGPVPDLLNRTQWSTLLSNLLLAVVLPSSLKTPWTVICPHPIQLFECGQSAPCGTFKGISNTQPRTENNNKEGLDIFTNRNKFTDVKEALQRKSKKAIVLLHHCSTYLLSVSLGGVHLLLIVAVKILFGNDYNLP